MKKGYKSTLMSIYFNYLLHGIALIILAQNTIYLQKQMGTDNAGIMFIVSGLGIGKLLTQPVIGVLSDKYGRKPFCVLGAVCYLIYFLGILVSPNIYVGFAFSFLVGFGNTCLDAGGTPALMEIMEDSPGTASVLTKFFIALGQFILPIMISVVVANNLYYGTSFIICAVGTLLTFLAFFKIPYPQMGGSKKEKSPSGEVKEQQKTKIGIEAIMIILLGFTTTATFHVVINWITTYSREVGGMAESAAQSVMSFYSTGAIISCICTAALIKKTIKPIRLLVVYPAACVAVLTALWLVPTPTVCRICAVLLGVFAGGGVLQMAASVIVEFYPNKKATMTSAVFTASGVAMFVGPLITAAVSKSGLGNVLIYDIIVTVLGVLMAVFINIRYKSIKPENN